MLPLKRSSHGQTPKVLGADFSLHLTTQRVPDSATRAANRLCAMIR